MSCAFLRDLAKEADTAMKADGGLYVSIRVCLLGVKILIEKGTHSHSYVFNWDEVEHTTTPAFEYVNKAMTDLNHYMGKWGQAHA